MMKDKRLSVSAIKEGTGWVFAVGIFIQQRTRSTGSVPLLAAGDTGVAAHANIEVYNQG